MLNSIDLAYFFCLMLLRNISTHNFFDTIELAQNVRTLREGLVFVGCFYKVQMTIKFLAAVNFFLLKGVRQVIPLTSEWSLFANFTFFSSAGVKVSRTNNNGSVIVSKILFAFNEVGKMTIWHHVRFIRDNFSWLKRQLVASLKVAILSRWTSQVFFSGNVKTTYK